MNVRTRELKIDKSISQPHLGKISDHKLNVKAVTFVKDFCNVIIKKLKNIEINSGMSKLVSKLY